MAVGDPTPRESADAREEKFWRDFLAQPDSMMGIGRRFFSRLPTNPRCQLCAAPFRGAGGRVLRLIGKTQSLNNPNVCNSCEKVLLKHHGGAEVEASTLFADIRGSTSVGESTTPTEFRALLDRFYTVASDTVFAHGGIVDKFVGDELVAAFPPFLGQRHAERAIETARALFKATGHEEPGGPWAPLGAGVHTGLLWFGAIGEGSHVEITVVGDVVNTTARLAAAATTGEIIVSMAAAEAADLDPGLERRSLDLKGKQHATEVVSVRIGLAENDPARSRRRSG